MSKKDTKHCYTSGEQIIDVSSSEKLVVIGHNPPRNKFKKSGTIVGKIENLCKELNCGRWELVNLYSVVAPNSDDIFTANATNDANKNCLKTAIKSANYIVAAWGDKGADYNVDKEVIKLIPNLVCVEFTLNRNPIHIRFWPKVTGLRDQILNNKIR